MEATFKIQAEELNDKLLKQIQKMFEGKAITITVTTEMDETAYLLASEANKKHLNESMASEPVISFTAKEFEQHIKELEAKQKNSGE